MSPIVLLLGAAALAAVAKKGGGGASKKVTSGTVTLKGGRTYRIDIDVSGRAVNELDHTQVAQGVQNGLGMNGARDIYVSPSIPIQASYTIDIPYDTPVVLNVAAQQQIGGLPAEYTFRGVQLLDRSN